jgi:hypothetical protein
MSEQPLAIMESHTVKINATWYSGNDVQIEDIKKLYTMTGESLFPTSSGLLIIEQEYVVLPDFDARHIDLTPFKARIVENCIPFSIAETEVSWKDSFCPVSYMFEDGYAEEQVKNAGGLFLETHDFCQTMTPLNEAARGFVVLGKWEEDNVMTLIGVKIPYGYTLIIEKGCIHGDTTLKGMYLMAMTSNHVTMQTADVVFLKSRLSGKNFFIKSCTSDDNLTYTQWEPIVDFGRYPGEGEKFTQQVNWGLPCYNPLTRIFNPFSNNNL